MTEQTAIANYLKYTGNKSIKITTALVDCDGVLYDSMKFHSRAWEKLMKKNNVKCSRDEFYKYEGMTGAAIIKMLFKRGTGRNLTDEEAWEYYKVKGRYFRELGEPEMMAGAKETLEAAKAIGLKCVLVTGSREPSILERINNDYGTYLEEERVTAIDVRNGKPSPEPYMKAQQKVGAKASECVVIENAPLGVQSGHAAGSFVIGVTTGPIPEKDLYKAGADIVYKDMNALAEALPTLIETINSATAE